MKPIDFDGMFDEKLAEYMKKNKGKHTEKQWEDLIPKLYKKFGDTLVGKIKSTPKEYYEKMTSKELVETLKAHLIEQVPVPEFLCSEIEKRGVGEELVPLLACGNEEAALYAANLLGGNEAAFDGYFSLVADEDCSVDLRDTAAENLKEKADVAKGRALEYYKEGKAKEYMLEILSRSKERDEEVFGLLCDAFENEPEKTPMHASYLAAYGDERALPLLLKKIEDRTIGFVDFQELKYAIEALGGEYNEPRDFTDDKDFIMIGEASEKERYSFPKELKN